MRCHLSPHRQRREAGVSGRSKDMTPPTPSNPLVKRFNLDIKPLCHYIKYYFFFLSFHDVDVGVIGHQPSHYLFSHPLRIEKRNLLFPVLYTFWRPTRRTTIFLLFLIVIIVCVRECCAAIPIVFGAERGGGGDQSHHFWSLIFFQLFFFFSLFWSRSSWQ